MSNYIIHQVRILVYHNRKVGIVTTTSGRLFACTYAAIWPLTEEMLKEDFRENRKPSI